MVHEAMRRQVIQLPVSASLEKALYYLGGGSGDLLLPGPSLSGPVAGFQKFINKVGQGDQLIFGTSNPADYLGTLAYTCYISAVRKFLKVF